MVWIDEKYEYSVEPDYFYKGEYFIKRTCLCCGSCTDAKLGQQMFGSKEKAEACLEKYAKKNGLTRKVEE
jgi:hypothetical protein